MMTHPSGLAVLRIVPVHRIDGLEGGSAILRDADIQLVAHLRIRIVMRIPEIELRTVAALQPD